ncbi:hypothetical protein NDU88_005046 [Pleurodeles waltl]|uniref:Uncharacterized protein n=1 Tax=Pleurodeles waltl TaxID=8319 RepID=A0AAV7RN64_PLEWA|nr:hypothetical protein NDU88_005046 [Pleurodeles waltl]
MLAALFPQSTGRVSSFGALTPAGRAQIRHGTPAPRGPDRHSGSRPAQGRESAPSQEGSIAGQRVLMRLQFITARGTGRPLGPALQRYLCLMGGAAIKRSMTSQTPRCGSP